MKEILLVAAENSAENYALQVVSEFRSRNAAVRFFGIGGERLERQGMEIVIPSRELAVVGIVEVLRHIPRIRRALNRLLKTAVERRAAAALLVDFPDFNLRLARRLKAAGIPAYYYISPTVWAWRYRRVHQLRRAVERLFIIFPFEIPIYQREKVPFTYVGHPLAHIVRAKTERREMRRRLGVGDNEHLVAILPGSREQEVRRLLPRMLVALDRLGEELPLRAALLQAHGIPSALLDDTLGSRSLPIVSQNDGYDLLQAADAALSSCGSANLECALLGTPFVAAYRVNRFSYALGKGLVKIGRYSIVNILARKEVVPELIQGRCRSADMARELRSVLTDNERRRFMSAEFARIREQLQQERDPAAIVCDEMASRLMPDSEGGEGESPARP